MTTKKKHVPDLAVDGHRPDVLSAPFYPVQLCLWAARVVHENDFSNMYWKLKSTGTLPWVERELEVKYMDVCNASQHEPFDKSYDIYVAGRHICLHCHHHDWHDHLHLVVPKKSMIVVFVRAIGFGTRWLVSSLPASRSNT